MKQFILFSFLLFIDFGFSNEFECLIDQNIYENKYGKYYVPLNHDRPAVNKIKNGRVYELETLQFIEKIYKKGTSIVHAGTYFGDMLPFFSHLVGYQQVWAFEPVRLNYLCAEKTVQLNKLKNVNLFNLGLSNQNSQLIMRTINTNGIPYGGGSHVITNKSYNEALCDESSDHFETITSISAHPVF